MNNRIVQLSETASTNSYLRELLKHEKLPEGTVISTDFQSAGRGQQGNSWESEAGTNLAFSIVIYPKHIDASEQFIISQLISLSIKKTLDDYVSDVCIKWPNDIYWKNKKLAGILIENDLCESSISQSIIGVGLNVNQQIFVSDASNPISLKQITGKDFDRKKILEKILVLFMSFYEQSKQKHCRDINEQYKACLFRLRGFHLYDDGSQIFSARIKDIGLGGILVLETDGGVERHFAFKEVKFIIE